MKMLPGSVALQRVLHDHVSTAEEGSYVIWEVIGR